MTPSHAGCVQPFARQRVTDSLRARRPIIAPKTRSLTSNTLWLLVAKTLGYAFMFLLPVLLVRKLSVHDFGIYKQVFLVVGTAVALLPLGFVMSAYYFLPRLGAQKRHVALNIVLFHLAVAGVACAVLVVRPDVLGAIFKDPSLATYAPVIGLIVLLWIPASCLEALALANGEARMAAVFIVVIQFSKAVLLFLAALWIGSVWALVVAALVHGVVQAAALLWYLSSRFPGYWRTFEAPIMRAQLAYALPLGAAGLLYWLQIDLHKYLVAHRFDAATFAIYAIGCFELPILAILNESVGSVLIPRMSELQKDGRRQEIVELAANALRKLAGVHVPLFVLLLITGRELISVLFTPQYLAAWPIFAINIILIPFSIPTIACDAVIRAYAEHRFFLIRLRVISTLLLVLGLWWGLDRFGLIGAISVVVGVNLFERLMTTIKSGRVLQVTWADAPLVADLAKIAGAAAFAGVVTSAVRAMLGDTGPVPILVVSAIVMGASYVAALLLLRVPTETERAQVASLLDRFAGRHGPPVHRAVPIVLPSAPAHPRQKD